MKKTARQLDRESKDYLENHMRYIGLPIAILLGIGAWFVSDKYQIGIATSVLFIIAFSVKFQRIWQERGNTYPKSADIKQIKFENIRMLVADLKERKSQIEGEKFTKANRDELKKIKRLEAAIKEKSSQIKGGKQ